VNSLRLHGGNAVVVTNPIMLLVRLNLGQSVGSGSVTVGNDSVTVGNAAIPVGCHLSRFSLTK